MRIPKYISPSALKLFYEDRREYYLKYLTDHRPPAFLQTPPMAVGSAFDAFIKAYLYRLLVGNAGPTVDHKIQTGHGQYETISGPAYHPDLLFKAQTEYHIRDEVYNLGIRCFNQYISSGAAGLLLVDLRKSVTVPRFEFTIEKNVTCSRTLHSVNVLGKPDLQFSAPAATNVVGDFKVNGYCGKTPTSPKPGYIRCLDSWGDEHKHSRSHNKSHPDAVIQDVDGILINTAIHLEDIDEDWANQLAMYSWVLGAEIGSNFIVGIEQLCGNPINGEMHIRVATHRCRISEVYQHELFGKLAKMWRIIHGPVEEIFSDVGLNERESREECQRLDRLHEVFKDDTPMDRFVTSMIRS